MQSVNTVCLCKKRWFAALLASTVLLSACIDDGEGGTAGQQGLAGE